VKTPVSQDHEKANQKFLPQAFRTFLGKRAQEASPEGARFQKRLRSFIAGVGT
jgi:hypothetical protein